MIADLPVQKALRAALIAAPAVTALVPPDKIIDRHLLPAPSPSIIIGQSDVEAAPQNPNRDREVIWHDVHVWLEETSTEGAKRIAAAVKSVILARPRPVLGGGLHLIDWQVTSSRVFRDPDGKTSHGVVTIRAEVGGVS